MFSSFMGGGNSSQTATQAPGGSSSAPKEESKSSFKAFGGKGKSLGTDISNTGRSSATASTSKKEERK